MSHKRIKKASRAQELQIAWGIAGGRRQPASGAFPGHKGDVRVRDRFRIEAKFTTALSYNVRRVELQKIRSECDGYERPVFVIDFKDQNLRTEDRWALIPYQDWEKLINATHDDS